MARRGVKSAFQYTNFTSESSRQEHEHESIVSTYLEQLVVYYKIVIAGELGVGKTSLIHTLTSSLHGKWFPDVTSKVDEHQRFVLNFSTGVRPRTVICTLVDTPPTHGTALGTPPQPDVLKDYIEQCNERYWKLIKGDSERVGSEPSSSGHSPRGVGIVSTSSGGGGGGVGMAAAAASVSGEFDPRVDCVVYLLPARRVGDQDLRAMADLSEVSTVLPVLARGDCLTAAERTRLRADVHAQLSQAGIPLEQGGIFQLSSASQPPELPFIVGAGSQIEGGQPLRKYPWGTFRAEQDSDLALLRGALFSEGSVLRLKHHTELMFAASRRKRTAAAGGPNTRRGLCFPMLGLRGRRGSKGVPGFLADDPRHHAGVALRLLFVLVASVVLCLSALLLVRTLSADPPPLQSVHVAEAAAESLADSNLTLSEMEASRALDPATQVVDPAAEGEDLSQLAFHLRVLDNLDRKMGGTVEIVMPQGISFLTFALSPTLVLAGLDTATGLQGKSELPSAVIGNSATSGPRGAGKDDDVAPGGECTPRVTSLPAHSTLLQTITGTTPDLAQPVTHPGTTITHRGYRFTYMPGTDRQGCGAGGCWDQFAVMLPCGDTLTEDDPTLTVRVVQPPPLTDLVPDLHLNLNVLETEAAPEGLLAGEVDLSLDWLKIRDQANLETLGFTQGEAHVVVTGPGALKMTEDDQEDHRHPSSKRRRKPEQLRVGPKSVFAVGPLSALAPLLSSLQYTHPGVSHGEDEVVATLTVWAPHQDGHMLASQVRVPVRVASGCSPASALVTGSGLHTGDAFQLVEVSVECGEKSLRAAGAGALMTVDIHSEGFRQTLQAHEGAGPSESGRLVVQFLRPADAYTLRVFINTLPLPDNPFKIAKPAKHTAPKRTSREVGGQVSGGGGNSLLEGAGARFDDPVLPSSSSKMSGTSGKDIYGSKSAYNGLMDALAVQEKQVNVKNVKRGGGLRGEGNLAAMFAKAAGTPSGKLGVTAYFANTESSASSQLTGGSKVAGGLPLPKFDQNGRVIGRSSIGVSKAGSTNGKKAAVPNIKATDIHATKDVLEGLGVFGDQIRAPKVGGFSGKSRKGIGADDSGMWLTGPDALDKGLALAQLDESIGN